MTALNNKSCTTFPQKSFSTFCKQSNPKSILSEVHLNYKFLYQGVIFIFMGYAQMLYNKFFGCTSSSSYLTNSCAQNSLARVSREGEKISSACAAQSLVASQQYTTVFIMYIAKGMHYYTNVKCGTRQRVKTSNYMNCSSKLP